MFECPRCGNETTTLVIPQDGKLSCRGCTGPRPKRGFDPRLHQTFISDGKTRLTNGKAWEIGNRVVSRDDHKTVINRITGKPAQY